MGLKKGNLHVRCFLCLEKKKYFKFYLGTLYELARSHAPSPAATSGFGVAGDLLIRFIKLAINSVGRLELSFTSHFPNRTETIFYATRPWPRGY